MAGAARQPRFRSGRRLVAVPGDAPEPRLPETPVMLTAGGRGEWPGPPDWCGPAPAGLRYRGLP